MLDRLVRQSPILKRDGNLDALARLCSDVAPEACLADILKEERPERIFDVADGIVHGSNRDDLVDMKRGAPAIAKLLRFIP